MEGSRKGEGNSLMYLKTNEGILVHEVLERYNSINTLILDL